MPGQNIPHINQIAPATARVVRESNTAINVADDYVPGIRVVDSSNFTVHMGIAYSYKSSLLLAPAATVYLLGRVGAKVVHMTNYLIRSDNAPIAIGFFEAPTVSVVGTPQVEVSKNRVNIIPATLSIFSGSTITADGALLDQDGILGGNKDTGSRETESEWLLKPNTDYVFKLVNNSAQAANIIAGFSWSETTLPE